MRQKDWEAMGNTGVAPFSTPEYTNPQGSRYDSSGNLSASGTDAGTRYGTNLTDPATKNVGGYLEGQIINPPKSYNDIRAEEMARAQQQIDAVNQIYNDMVSQENIRGTDRLGQTRSINARAGLIGSDFGSAQMGKTTDTNKQLVEAINHKRSLEIQGIFDKVDKMAMDRANAEKSNYLASYENYQKYRSDEIAKGQSYWSALAKQNVAFDALTPEDVKMMKDQTGFQSEDALKLWYAAQTQTPYDIKYDDKSGTIVAYKMKQDGTLDVVTKKVGAEGSSYQDVQTTSKGVVGYNPTTKQYEFLLKFDENQTPDIQNYEYYSAQQKAAGKTPVDYNTWLNMDANRKAKANGAGGTDKETTAFYNDIAEGQKNLQSGLSWGQVWNRIYSKYATGRTPDQQQALRDLLDQQLEKDTWAKPGAYQDFLKSKPSSADAIIDAIKKSSGG